LISDFDDEEQLEKNILYYFENNLPNQNKQEVNKFSRKELTGQLCKLLNGL